jgi:hypothetical protein
MRRLVIGAAPRFRDTADSSLVSNAISSTRQLPDENN